MKKPILTLVTLTLSMLAMAQPYTNSWIDYTQTYFKIPIAETGVYRITKQELEAAGVPVSTFNPEYLQVFYRGNEQFVTLNGEVDGTWDDGDYLEFYGEQNDGTLDADLYRNKSEQPHQYYSLYTDSSAYFITWSATTKGKRFTTFFDNNYSGYIAEAYYMHTAVKIMTDVYWDGAAYIDYAQYSQYTNGEGWLTANRGRGSVTNYVISTPGYNTSGPLPTIKGSFYGKSRGIAITPDYNHHIRVDIGADTIIDKTFLDYYNYTLDKILKPANISANTTVTFRVVNDIAANADNNAIAYFEITYPRNFDLQNQANGDFSLTGSSSNSYIKFTNYKTGAAIPYMYDLTNGLKIEGTLTGTDAEFIIPNGGNEKHLVLINLDDIKPILKVQPITFQEVNLNAGYDMLIITHNKLLTSVTDYAAYKTSRGFNPLVITVDQLYDQFYYGVNYHPLAIRHFCDYMLKESSTAPEFLLLIGKGQTNDLIRKNLGNLSQDLVPTIGVPPTDYLLTAGLNGTLYEPAIATGRIPAKSNEHVNIYLNKLKEFESRVHDLTDKNMLHLGGGRDETENNRFRFYLETFGEIAKDSFLGASVTSFYKDDALTVSSALKKAIQDNVNNGITQLTYFGHGAADILEIDIGQANEFKNAGKYPHMLFSGCILGNTFAASSICENFLFEPNAGALTWMANSSYGFDNQLREFTQLWYRNLLVNNYGEPLGNIVIETIKQFQKDGSDLTLLQAPQITFHGDPSVVLFSPNKPDYYIQPDNGFISPANTTALSDSFSLALVINNKGRATSDSLDIVVRRTLPSNKSITYPVLRVPYIPNTDTIYYKIPGEGITSRGTNLFEVILDQENKIDELPDGGEFNNSIIISKYLAANGVDVIFPLNYSVVNSTQTTLRVQSADLFIKSAEYIFEIDTTKKFNSSFKQNSGIITSGLLADWQVNLLPTDSITYYWRARLNKPENEGGIWHTASFTYIQTGKNGWHQGHFGQFQDILTTNVSLDSSSREFEFLRTTSDIYSIYSSGKNQPAQTRLMRIDYLLARLGWISNGIALMVIDPCDLSRYIEETPFNQKSTNYIYGGFEEKDYYKVGTYSGMYFYNTTTQANRDSFVAFINRIPDGFNIMLHNGATTGIDSWGPAMFDAFNAIGATKISNLKEGHPYICFGTKGANFATELFADTSLPVAPEDQQISGFTVYYPCKNEGSFESDVIGPAKSWGTLYSDFITDDSADLIAFEVLGLDTNNRYVSLDYTEEDTLDLSGINAKLYPYLKVKVYLEDTKKLTPAQLKYWGVSYQQVPEGTINPELKYAFYNKQVQEGDSISMSVAFENISQLDMDSMLVQIKTEDESRNIKLLKLLTYPPLLAGEWFSIDYSFSTKGYSGNNKIEITVNPKRAQAEQILANNIVIENFNVSNDNINPLLDVVFDGQHIMNDEIISPNPNIVITASDENPYLFIQDTSSIMMQIRYPGKANFERIYFNRSDITFTPANSIDKKAKVQFSPRNLESGIYELKVQASDASDNQAGEQEYGIRFQVIREATVTHFYPYPNPFTTNMRFVFTLTGVEPPDYIKISIMTISGRIVREITTEELGPLRIGNNVSQFTWDGTDMYGDKLANGVYLYKVTARLNGEDLKLRQTSADGSFINGVGKIYILR